jgi:hypothetical protein
VLWVEVALLQELLINCVTPKKRSVLLGRINDIRPLIQDIGCISAFWYSLVLSFTAITCTIGIGLVILVLFSGTIQRRYRAGGPTRGDAPLYISIAIE